MKQEDETFYRDRSLPVPGEEHRPEGPGALRELVEGAGGRERPLVVLGGGEHLRRQALGEQSFDVVRTVECDRIRKVDLESNTVRVEAGATWGGLQEALADQERSLDGYGLYPRDATVGGLLGRWQPLEKQHHAGDLRGGCIALRTATPAGADYSYLPAPRKASGPDSRYLYIGGEAALGVILEATLVVEPELPARLVRIEAETCAEAVEAYRRVVHFDVDPSWCRWSSAEGGLEVSVRAPEPILVGWERGMRSEFDGGPEFLGGEAAAERRRELEEQHPAARSSGRAGGTRQVVWNLADLAEAVDRLAEGLEEAVVHDWGLHRATAYLIGESDGESDSEESGMRRALSRREVCDTGDAVWPAWAQELKSRFYPKGGLAVGP